MRSLSSIALFLLLAVQLAAQSPHGDDLKLDCAACHTSVSWEIPMDSWDHDARTEPRISDATGMVISTDTFKFSHNRTDFQLTGQHKQVDCRQCHASLVFSEANGDCVSCHTDMHRSTVGFECARCHTTDNWLVDFIPELHDQNGFPLLGAHATASCTDCHISESGLEFPRIGNDCVSCHLADFQETTNPDHEEAGFPTDCIQCHRQDGEDWEGETFNHDFFPLTLGHETNDCAACHTGGSFADTPTDCVACHETDFNGTQNPDHQSTGFTTDCASCHSTNPGWMPADFAEHDALFPIYSGAHEGEWIQCTDCHTDPTNYALFDCLGCHTNPETDDGHDDVVGYIYENTACLACHPTGDTDEVFDHNGTNFPLTGAHLTTDCIQCHANGYEGTPTACEACHTTDYQQTTNPDHNSLGLPTDCASCHTTEPDWMPASFDIHDDFYPLIGAHAAIANDCAACHNGDYNNTPNDCFGCHQDDFNMTDDPDHAAAQFPTDCAGCHNQSSWEPATFNHDDFFVLDGAHAIIADDCVACHNGDYTNTPNTCDGCHQDDFDNTTNPNHPAIGIPTDCAMCHTTGPGWVPAEFPIHDDYYVLNGAHSMIANDCATCHNGDYNNTPNTCDGCHIDDYNSTTDPDHASAQFPVSCDDCHSEDAWTPSTFDHNSFYPLNGAHAAIADDCVACHNGDYTNTPNTCDGCHIDDYNSTTDPNHAMAQFPVSCDDCHTEDAWVPATFNHNDFWVLDGAHAIIADDCVACHNGDYTNTPNTCDGCHQDDFDNTTNPNHQAIGIPTDCAMCHTTEPGWTPASFPIHDDYYVLNGAHNMIANDCATCHNGDYNNTPNTCDGCHIDDYNSTSDPDHAMAQFPVSCDDCHTEDTWVPATFNHDDYFVLDGGHAIIADDCVACHNGDYTNTPNTCDGCHQDNFDNTTNPNHQALGIPTDCALCHTTGPGWVPAEFPIHDDYYVLNGAHNMIANDCATCHNGDYNNTPNTCDGCHIDDYNSTTDPDHNAAQFNTDCQMCHSEDTWVPATFDHDSQYFPIYSGAHQGQWSECLDCHTVPSNYAIVTCTSCHINPETGDAHTGVNGYVYESSACLACHPTGDADNIFDHNMTAFPLTGAHLTAECLDCHSNGFEGTPTDCAFCHTVDFDNTTNPNHNSLGLSTDCAMCHTTEPGWMPADFPVHDDYYVLNGAHNMIANDCAACHNADYNNTPNTCDGCHIDDYNSTTDPDHALAQFPVSCDDCHNEDAWVPANFNHDDFFVLDGGHAIIADDCVACHNGDYANTPNTCDGCHQDNFDNTTNPNHQVLGIPTDCAMCHTTGPGWEPADFPIHDDYYVLNGAHNMIANDCATCHNGDYNNTPNTCDGCHTDDYNSTTDPDHALAQFPVSCEDCHTEDAWVPATFNHDDFYVLNGAHTAIADDCVACHNGDYTNTPNTCDGCHIDDYNSTTNPDHNAAQFPVSCEDCHNEDAWVPATFNHDDFWVLDGAHALIADNCTECHTGGNYSNTPNTCDGCHQDDFDNTTNPNHPALGIPTDCDMCHTTEPGWTPADFPIHDDYYVLNGAHNMIANDCATCHNGDYNNTPNTCDGCHIDDYNSTTNPDHSASQFPVSCEDCHNEDAWVPATFNHDDFWVLDGAHALIADNCTECHTGGNYSNTPNTCDGCHTDDYNNTTNPNHQVLGIPTNCDMCHTTEPGWMPADFPIHDDYYVLNGAHNMIANDCAACHNGDYNNTPNTCDGCHIDDYNMTNNPDHQAAQFPISCDDCHTEDAWSPSTFNHNDFYPLNGAHAAIADDCVSCHNGNYTNTPNTCDGCHIDDYNNTTNPNHAAAQFPVTCDDCHTEDAWVPANFNHNDFWVLDGAHALIADDCAACHQGGNYANTPNTCDGCHQDDYNTTTNPSHPALGIPTNCDMCHTTNPGWIPADFPIHNDYYVLNGAHAVIADDCAACHNGDYNNTPNTCDGCHIDDYNMANNPNHLVNQFPVTCEDCHTENTWIPSTFNHNNYYVLDGAHLIIANDCAACHNGNYTNTPNTCEGCHLTDYNQSVNPNHTALGIPTDCAMCHTTNPDWMPATFPIHNNYYPLNGAHAAIANDCAACHNGDYNNTPNTCYGCHQSDYNQANNPNHLSAGFPTTCESCHTENAWVPANWDHDGMYFPIFSGKHDGEWTACVDCHTIPNNYTMFSCIDCHEHDDPVDLLDKHDGINNYEYASPACYACHPDGEK